MNYSSLIFLLGIFCLTPGLHAADSTVVICKTPAGFAGASATISGTIHITKMPDQGYPSVVGILQILIGGSTATPLVDAAVEVLGVKLDDGSMSFLVPDDKSYAVIYINPYSPDISYVEKDGEMYVSDCSGY